jgi:hypothetical protein
MQLPVRRLTQRLRQDNHHRHPGRRSVKAGSPPRRLPCPCRECGSGREGQGTRRHPIVSVAEAPDRLVRLPRAVWLVPRVQRGRVEPLGPESPLPKAIPNRQICARLMAYLTVLTAIHIPRYCRLLREDGGRLRFHRWLCSG